MIEQLVQDLPEVYQPVFGHPEFSTSASRPSSDRLKQVEQIYVTLEKLLGRPLKVLDLGCAQGFFSLSLAQRGAVVHGVDYLDQNIVLCKALAKENPCLNISFAEGQIEDIVPALQPGQYDLVLGLSVFHHLVCTNGVPKVKALLERLAKVSGALLLEMALQNEPLYWGPSQPNDPRELLNDIGFVHLIGFNGTHLAKIPRPLFITSNQYWVLGDLAGNFDWWSFEPHNLAHGTHQNSRRYFFGKKCIVKHYILDHPTRGLHNKTEYNAEIDFLRIETKNFTTAHLITYGSHDSEAWIALEKLPGRLLVDLIRECNNYDSHKILLSVLQQLSLLEALGLYHNDVRTWNILVETSSENVYLIDYGSISRNPQDCVWPTNIFLSFFIFIKELVSRQVDDPFPIRSISISPYSLPDPYKAWAISFWQKPLNEWSFKKMHQSLLAWSNESNITIQEQSPMLVWMQSMEEGLQLQKKHANHLIFQMQTKAAQAEANAAQAEALARQAEVKAEKADDKATQAQVKVEQAEAKATQAQFKLEQAEAKATQAQVQADQAEATAAQAELFSKNYLNELHGIYASKSWRVTAPIRNLKNYLKNLKK
jgi:O-antigen chain-terminating methyltransferase